MANKEKLLLSAQKYLEKGRVAKAIGCFEKVVKIDPKDSRCRLKVAELYAQNGNRDKAVQEYEGIAKIFLDNNFSLKAIAVFKQILKLAPEKKELHRQLGELNEQQGLIGNALSEYKRLAEYYQQEELVSETLGVLKKISELDPKNISVRMRVAEYSFRLDAKDEAKKELEHILPALQSKGDFSALSKFYEFYLSLFPEDFDIELAAAECLLSSENPQEGIEALEKLGQREPQNVKLLNVLANGYAQTDDSLKYKSTLNDLLDLCPEDLDLCKKCVHALVVAGDIEDAIEKLENWQETFQAQNRISDLQDLYEQLAEEFPGDEKTEEALSAIRVIIKNHADYSNGVDFGSYSRPSADTNLEVTEVSLGLDEVPGAPKIPLNEPEMADGEMSVSDELLLGTDDLVAEDSATCPTAGASEDFVLETSGEAVPFNLAASSTDTSAGAAEPDQKDVTVSTPEKNENQPSDDSMELGDDFFDFDLSEEVSDIHENPEGPDPHAELEEADFYLRQGLLDEAERACNNILEVQPDFQEAKSKLVQIEKKRNAAASLADGGHGEGGSGFATDSLSIDVFAQQGDSEDLFLDGLMADSQKGVSTVIGQEDTESHFNLGIAYKEMGQYDEAITEFEQAQRDPVRFVDCITLINHCLMQKGSLEEAEEVFLDALGKDISEDDRLILNFEMGLLYLEQEKSSEALEKFHFVLNLDPFYRDVGERVKKLQESLGTEGATQSDSIQDPDEPLAVNSGKNRVSYV